MALVYDPRTGKLVDDGTGVPGNPARAAAMQAQYNQPVTGPRTVVPLVQPPVLAGMGTVDRGPARALPAPTGDNPTLAAAMQAQYNQPVTGPRGLVTPGQPITPFFNVQQLPDYGNPGAVPYAQRQAEYAQRNPAPVPPPTYPEVPEFNSPPVAPRAAPAPAAPAAPTSMANPNAINVGGALGQAYLGSMAAVPATALDALRRGVTNLAGGDVNTLPGGQAFYSDQAFGAIDQGLGAFAQANRDLGNSIGRGVRGLLGVQEAAPAAPAAPAVAPTPTVPRTAAPTPPAVPQAPSPAPVMQVPPLDIGGLNAQLAQTVGTQRAEPTLPALPTPQSAGINFGFGVNGSETARQYLDRMQTQDQAARLRRQENIRLAERAAMDSNLADAVRSGDPIAIRGARAQLQQFDVGRPGLEGLATELQGGVARNQAAMQQAQLQEAGALTRAGMDAESRLAAADLTGQYGVLGQQARGQAAVAAEQLKSMSPAARKAAVEADLMQTRLNALLEGVQQGQFGLQDVIAGTRAGQEREAAPILDPMTGAPLTPEIIQLLQQMQADQLRQRAQR